MLSGQRHRMILKILEKKRSVTVAELTELLNISQSTARRDIAMLDFLKETDVTFAPIGGGSILTDERMDEFKDAADIVLCSRLDPEG